MDRGLRRHHELSTTLRACSLGVLSCLGRCWELWSPRNFAVSREEFHSRHLRPWTWKRKEFESLLSRLQHPRVRDVAWSVLAPGLCCDADATFGHEVFTDAAMKDLLGDVSEGLLALDADPRPLDAWLTSHDRSGSRFVGHYYESLVHFALAELGKVEVALYSEPIPKETKQRNASPAASAGDVVRRFKPPLKTSLDVDFFCSIHEAAFLEGGQLRISFKIKRGRSREAFPLPVEATLTSAQGVRRPASHRPSSPPDSDRMDGHVLFEDVSVSEELEFAYAPGFPAVPLRPTKMRQPIQGEVDYILQPDQSSPQFLHLEVAVKFYLAARDEVATWDDFIAPNPRDILGLKLRHMLSHQLRMGQTPHIRNLLAARVAGNGQRMQSMGISSRLWMNGRLFLAATAPLDETHGRPDSWHTRIPMLSPDLEVGWWCRFRELDRVLPATCRFLVLKKPYWLAPLRGSGGRHADHGRLRTRGELLKEARSWKRFQYVAVLAVDAGGFEEISRGFVVPDEWPQTPRRGRRHSGSRSVSPSSGSSGQQGAPS
ncbi:DDX42 [Symbiodinium natans]|uniref:DDX42 protein n=1 Tax=Symbiodinium natans TaxID=878477 RepID=A0A812I5L4_9DINO|nr:DDX42 [Symbiodinium natans]